jgi:hypothetical protein
MSAGLSYLTVQSSSAAYSATKQKQQAIRDALINFLRTNKRLPCPDTKFLPTAAPDGIEVAPGGSCTGNTPAYGIIPYQTLGLPKSAALDGWENYFSYEVSNLTPANPGSPPSQDWTFKTNLNNGTTFFSGSTGNITVNTRNSTGTSTLSQSNIVAVIISFGKNGSGAVTSLGTTNAPPVKTVSPDEYQNTLSGQNAVPNLFWTRDYTTNSSSTGGAFDDVLLTISRSDLLTPLFSDGSIQSAESQFAQQAVAIQNAVVSFMLANSCYLPTSLTNISSYLPSNIPSTSVDPWGGAISYSRGTYNNLTITGLCTQGSQPGWFYNGTCKAFDPTGNPLINPIAYPITTSTSGVSMYSPSVSSLINSLTSPIVTTLCPAY